MLHSGISYASEPFSFNQIRVTEFQKNKNSLELSLKKSDRLQLRKIIQQKALQEINAYLFGNYLDTLENTLSQELDQCISNGEKTLNQDKSIEQTLKDQICNLKFNVPENFLVEKMDFQGEVDKNDLKFRLYQNFQGRDILLLETPVAIGGVLKDYSTGKHRLFPTPSGTFYLERVIFEPWYYPKEWAKEKKVQRPGIKNAYGLWMAEFYKKDLPVDYAFSYPHDADFRIHSTNDPKKVGTRSSHGCIRLHPDIAAEMFPAILHYTKHKEPKKNGRGTVYPLEKSIKIKIY